MVFFPARRSVSFTAVGHDGSWDWATTDGNLSPTATMSYRVVNKCATDCEDSIIDDQFLIFQKVPTAQTRKGVSVFFILIIDAGYEACDYRAVTCDYR